MIYCLINNIKGHRPSNGEHIIFYTSAYGELDHYGSNKAVVVYDDHYAQIVDKHELEQLLAEEIVKLRTKFSINK